MIKAEQIPYEVIVAACEEYGGGHIVDMKHAIAAALSAWKGAEVKTTFWPNDDGVWIVPRHGWLLPLAQKDATDE